MKTGSAPGAAALAMTPPTSDPPPTTDRELMAEVKEGDLARLGELFERHHGRLYNFFLRLARDRSTAEDLVQEVFVRILKYRGTFKSEAEFTPWMFQLARNAATDLWRARPKELQHEENAPEPAADVAHPIERLDEAEKRRRLALALEALPREKRELLLLARFSEMRYEEIAGLLDTSVGAIKVRVHRAMKELKAAFDTGLVPARSAKENG